MLAAHPVPATVPPPKAASSKAPFARSTLLSTGEKPLATCIARLRRADDGWRGTLTGLDRSGAIARAYFTAGLRDVVLELPDGRRARAQITGTSFSTQSNERTCDVSVRGEFV